MVSLFKSPDKKGGMRKMVDDKTPLLNFKTFKLQQSNKCLTFVPSALLSNHSKTEAPGELCATSQCRQRAKDKHQAVLQCVQANFTDGENMTKKVIFTVVGQHFACLNDVCKLCFPLHFITILHLLKRNMKAYHRMWERLLKAFKPSKKYNSNIIIMP